MGGRRNLTGGTLDIREKENIRKIWVEPKHIGASMGDELTQVPRHRNGTVDLITGNKELHQEL